MSDTEKRVVMCEQAVDELSDSHQDLMHELVATKEEMRRLTDGTSEASIQRDQLIGLNMDKIEQIQGRLEKLEIDVAKEAAGVEAAFVELRDHQHQQDLRAMRDTDRIEKLEAHVQELEGKFDRHNAIAEITNTGTQRELKEKIDNFGDRLEEVQDAVEGPVYDRLDDLERYANGLRFHLKCNECVRRYREGDSGDDSDGDLTKEVKRELAQMSERINDLEEDRWQDGRIYERAKIATWLRKYGTKRAPIVQSTCEYIADKIERGDHEEGEL